MYSDNASGEFEMFHRSKEFKEKIMDDRAVEQIRALIPALKALQESVRHAVYGGSPEGVAKMAIKSYTKLHAKFAELMSDDDYITDVLVLDIDEKDSDEAKVAQLELAANQLLTYVKAKLNEERWGGVVDKGEIKQLGKELQDQVLNFTRNTLRRALSTIEDMPVPPIPPVPPQPGMPPIPPIPPHPHGPKFRVEIHTDDDEDQEKPKNTPPGIV